MRVLLAGLGSIGRRHLRLLRQHQREFEFVAYRSRERETETPEDVVAYDSLDAALATDPGIAFVTNPTALHVETAIECALNGCDLFVEKPLSHSRDGLGRLQEVVDTRDIVTHVGCQFRFHPVLKRVQSLLDREALGAVYSFRAYCGSYLPDWRPQRDYRETYSSARESGGGAVLDLVHEIDYSYWLFGEVTDVHARTDHVSHLEIDAEDLAEIILSLESGPIGNIHLDYLRRAPRRTLEVICREGTISADFLEGTIEIDRPDSHSEESFDFERDDLFRSQLEYFLSRIDDERRSMNDITEATSVLDIALRARDNV